MLSVAENGYLIEKQYAFFPLLPWTISFMASFMDNCTFLFLIVIDDSKICRCWWPLSLLVAHALRSFSNERLLSCRCDGAFLVLHSFIRSAPMCACFVQAGRDGAARQISSFFGRCGKNNHHTPDKNSLF
jgi:hypothetical protein